jgi:hypothetical protein
MRHLHERLPPAGSGPSRAYGGIVASFGIG